MTRRFWFPKHYADVVQRLRVPCGFVMAAALVLFAAPARWSIWVGLPVAVSGLFLRAWAAGHLAKNERLATSGPYGYVRNPLYIGTLLAAAGCVIAARQPWLAVLFGAVFTLVYLPAIELEEQHLRRLFPEYDGYAANVPMLRARGPSFGGEGRFRWALYMRNQEYQAFLGLVITWLFLAWRAGEFDGLLNRIRPGG